MLVKVRRNQITQTVLVGMYTDITILENGLVTF